ncbi:MAG: MarR family transcriptional regulator [Selenomonadaceae bacterium]
MNNIKLLLSQFAELYEKQDMLNKLTSKDILYGYGYSEIHCIDLIGKIEQPNVTKISLKMALTTSAVSKIVKKLLASGDIVSYQCEDNRKEIYYRLTEKGQTLFEEHIERHSAWEERDKNFLAEYDDAELKIISKFLGDFNKYLESKISSFK